MVHAVSHLASRVAAFSSPAAGTPKTSPKPATNFAGNLQSAFGASAPVATPPQDTTLKALFGQPVKAAPDPPPPPPPAPTAESVFGANPWMTAPTGQGPNGVKFSYNPLYFATPATAQKVAQMVGGTVTQSNQFTPNGGPFQQQQPNWMVQLPNGNQINPGILASFYTHGYPQSYIDGLIAGYVNG